MRIRNEKIETGTKFSRLTIKYELEKHLQPSGKSIRRFLCECECGKEKEVLLQHIKSGRIKSCGCYNIEVATERGVKRFTKHGNYYHPLWSTYSDMKRRCYNEKREDYRLYGGRGIKVEDVWLGEEGFNNFVKDMGLKPDKFYSIDRINVDGNYGPTNCKWSTPKEQANNRR
jgi:hypothetical protein